jgi:hypothetical protein
MRSQGLTAYSVRIGGQFKLGAFMELGARLSELTVERDKLTSTATGTSLVVIKSKNVDEHFGAINYRKANLKELKEFDDQAARHAGVRAGRVIEIQRSVES